MIHFIYHFIIKFNKVRLICYHNAESQNKDKPSRKTDALLMQVLNRLAEHSISNKQCYCEGYKQFFSQTKVHVQQSSQVLPMMSQLLNFCGRTAEKNKRAHLCSATADLEYGNLL